MKPAVVLAVAVLMMFVLAVAVSAETPTHRTWLICDNGARYTHKPKRCGFRVGGRTISVHGIHWQDWGAKQTIAHGKSSGKVRVVARMRKKVTNCVGPRTDWFYEKVKLQRNGKTKKVNRFSLKPQCNNP
jgi:hypothetical protein